MKSIRTKILARTLPLVAGAMLLLSACSPITSGTVVDKNYEPDSIYYTSECVPTGQSACGYTRMVEHYNPESWRLKVKPDSSSGNNGSTKEKWVEVSESKYESTKIGDHYSKDE